MLLPDIDYTNSDANLVYYMLRNGENNLMVPAWKVKNGNDTFVFNAITGELLHK